jgi:hypothetical protein
MKKIALIGFLCTALSAHADLLTINESETIKSEQIPKLATLGAVSLTRTGSSIRQKKVLFIPFDVYRASLFVSDLTKFSRNTENTIALDSLQNMTALALVLDFKRSVSGKDMAASFTESLSKNNIKDSPALTQFKTEIQNGGDVAAGQRVVISAKDNSIITLELGKKQIEIKGDAEFIRAIFSIWLGVSTDDGLKNLREKLILSN